MQIPKDLLLDVRTLYAVDSSRAGAHYIRRHRVRLLKEDPSVREPILLGTSIVEVAHLEEPIFEESAKCKEIFNADQEWASIGDQLFDFDKYAFKDSVESRFPALITKKNVAFIRHIRIQPSYRESGWGRALVKGIKEHFRSSCGILLTMSEGSPKPAGVAHPLLPDHWEQNEPYPQGRLLRGLFEAGFHSLGNAALYVANLDTTR